MELHINNILRQHGGITVAHWTCISVVISSTVRHSITTITTVSNTGGNALQPRTLSNVYRHKSLIHVDLLCTDGVKPSAIDM